MRNPAVLADDVGLVNFSLVQGADKTIRVAMTTSPPSLDISSWDFEVSFYIGQTQVKTVVIDTTLDPGGITINGVDKFIDMAFTGDIIAAIPSGKHAWDLRFDTGTGNGQILKGIVTIGKV